MKRFLIHVDTYWCGMDAWYAAKAESELELSDLAEHLAYENYLSYGLETEVAEENGYDPDEMSDLDWETLWNNVEETDYYSWDIEEFDGDDEEWKLYGEYYKPDFLSYEI